MNKDQRRRRKEQEEGRRHVKRQLGCLGVVWYMCMREKGRKNERDGENERVRK